MSSKLGPHIIEPYRIKPYDGQVANSKPRIIKVVGGPTEIGFLTYLNALFGSQNHLYIARVFPFEQAVKNAYDGGASPYAAADIMIAALNSFVYPNGYGYCYFECGMNEPPDTAIPWLNQYYAYIVPWLHVLGIKTVSFNFSVCHPPLAAWAQLGNALSAIRSCGRDALVGLHQYGLFGNMQDYADNGNDARVLRHRCIPELQDCYVVITETGLDEPGWKQAGINTEDYIADLKWLDYELRKDNNVIGATIYTQDSAPDWDSFRVDGGLADQLFAYWQTQNATPDPIFPSVPVPPPSPPPLPDPKPVPGNYRVIADALNVRSSPEALGETNKIRLQGIAPLPHNTQVQVLETRGKWGRIAPPFETWVHMDYIEEI